MGSIYLLTPFIMSYLFEISIDPELALFSRVFATITCVTQAFTLNFIMFMVSSLSQYNTILAKHIYPRFNSRSKYRLIYFMKLDSFIGRLSKEYIGFRCFTLLKFKRLSFYHYILGISSCFILINNLNKELKD